MAQKVEQRAAALSVVATAALTATEILVGIFSGAVSVLANGVQSALDLIAALTAWFAVSQASKPPDKSHRYGHGKFESLLGAIQALLIWATAGFIAADSFQKLVKGTTVDHPTIAMLMMGISVVVDFSVARYLFAVAKRFNSLALEADAWHLQADGMAALSVFFGLGILNLTGWHFIDPLLAIFVSVLIVKAGFEILKQAVAHLLDTALPEEEEVLIDQVLNSHSHRFINAHRLRTRQSGKHRYIDLHLVVRDEMTVDEAHKLCDDIERDICKVLPNADVTIHVESVSAFKEQGIEDSFEQTKSPQGKKGTE
ncbi:MAG: cation diffusion facilitator family transporter [Armatimonadetes bacterium]|nr:cation diffusion facilitator family transporter [Armatimonadota bacterium]